jgi:Ca2+:H+ antiporter
VAAAPSASTLRTVGTPIVALLVLVLVWGRHLGPVLVTFVGIVLIVAVLVAVHHAEVVAHRVGEPLGSLILAIAVTVIEVGLILSITASGGRRPRRWPATRSSPP